MIEFVLNEPQPLKDVELKVVHEATVDILREILGTYRPHIVHLSCHGMYDQRAGLGCVALCSGTDRSGADFVSSFRFATLLEEPRTIRLVVVSACHGMSRDPLATFSGVAECIHGSGVPAVVALQSVLRDETGHAIALNFYRYLLRERLSVEDSVTRIRRYLFLNNYMFSECFGVALFQGNCSLTWPREGEPPGVESGIRSFVEYTELFDAAMRQKLMSKVSSELDRIADQLRDFDSLTPVDLLVALNIFGDEGTAITVLRRVRRVDVPVSAFLKLAKLAIVLCHTPHENKQLVTGLLLHAAEDPDEYMRTHEGDVSEKLDSGFLLGEIKKILSEAIKVNGTDRTFVALVKSGEAELLHEHIYNLKTLSTVPSLGGDALDDPTWARLCGATVGSACGFAVPRAAQVKLFVGGEQVAEYRHGKWRHTDLADLRAKLSTLASETELDTVVLFDVVRKALFASEHNRGRIFVLQKPGGIEPTLEGHYKNIATSENINELKKRKITDFEPRDYLNMTEGDGAVVISADGSTVAVNAKLATNPNTQVDPIPGTGSRHLAGQKATKESDTVIVVVSDDGPVTVFHCGEVFLRKS